MKTWIAPLLLTGLLPGCFNPGDPVPEDDTGSTGAESTGTPTPSDTTGPSETGDDSSGDPADPCDPNPCVNGGTCSVEGDQPQCDCPEGFGGQTCEDAPCDPDPCVNGTCSADQCECDPGWEGDVCDVDIDDCADDPCLNGGTCTDEVDGFSCECATGWEGDDCGTNIDDCAPNPCQNGGMCVDGLDDFTCNCPPGSLGPLCECVQGPPTQVSYTSMGTFVAPMLYNNPPGITVTGSNAINVLNLNGLGIVGGVNNNTIDGAEWIEFSFDSPSNAVNTSYFVSSAGNQNGDGFVGAAFVEAFDELGVSQGVVPVNGTGTFNMGTLFGPGLISYYRVTANVDNHRISSATAQATVCSP